MDVVKLWRRPERVRVRECARGSHGLTDAFVQQDRRRVVDRLHVGHLALRVRGHWRQRRRVRMPGAVGESEVNVRALAEPARRQRWRAGAPCSR